MKRAVAFLICALFFKSALSHSTKGEAKVVQIGATSGGFAQVLLVSDYPLNWHQAKDDCKSRGMSLLSITSEEKNIIVKSAIYDMPEEKFWTSGNDFGSNGKFFWDSTGQPLSYADWEKEPNFIGWEHCVLVIWKWKWHNYQCEAPNKFICEGNVRVQPPAKN